MIRISKNLLSCKAICKKVQGWAHFKSNHFKSQDSQNYSNQIKSRSSENHFKSNQITRSGKKHSNQIIQIIIKIQSFLVNHNATFRWKQTWNRTPFNTRSSFLRQILIKSRNKHLNNFCDLIWFVICLWFDLLALI